MKRKLLKIISTITMALLMFATPCLATGVNSQATKEQTQITRTIKTTKTLVDYQNSFNEFDNVSLQTEGTITTFEGYQSINLSELEELDEVGDLTLSEDESIPVRYNFAYDHETNLVILSATIAYENEEPLIETIYGAAFINENGEIDALLDIDGEYMLLSELQDAGLIQDCGWFKNAFKKVSKAVKKVCKTAIGVVGAVATVVVPASIGVVMAATGVGLVATIAVGAVAGAAIAASTAAASTAQQDGEIDWETVGICAGVGAAVGAISSGISYGVTKTVQAVKAANAAKAVGPSKNVKSFDTYNAFQKEYGSASQYIDDGEWHHIVEQQTVTKGINTGSQVYSSKNTVAISKNLHQKISGYYSSTNKALGMTNRAYINTLSYEQQYAKGLEILKMFAKELGETIIWL